MHSMGEGIYSKISTAISSMTDHLGSDLGVALPKADLPSIAITLAIVAVIIVVTYVVAKVVDRVLVSQQFSFQTKMGSHPY